MKFVVKQPGRRLGLRPQDIGQLVTQPRSVAEMAERVRRIEDGDVQLRVRTSVGYALVDSAAPLELFDVTRGFR